MDAVSDAVMIDPSRAEAVMRFVTFGIFAWLGAVIIWEVVKPLPKKDPRG